MRKLVYQTKAELLATAKANKVTGVNSNMTKAAIIERIEAKGAEKTEDKPKPSPKRGEYYR